MCLQCSLLCLSTWRSSLWTFSSLADLTLSQKPSSMALNSAREALDAYTSTQWAITCRGEGGARKTQAFKLNFLGWHCGTMFTLLCPMYYLLAELALNVFRGLRNGGHGY